MSDGSVQRQRWDQPAVPVLQEQRVGEILAAVPARGQWRYRPRRVGLLWRNRTFRVIAVFTLLALCGVVILALVRDQTGTEGFLVGLSLAVLPVPVLMTAFRWLDRVEPSPWRNLLFAFAWGACAAALVAILANSFATRWIADSDPGNADTLGATVIAPVVEESAKAAAVLLLFLFRRRDFTGIVDGVVVAGFTATGFAFTENILYLGNAFGEDQQLDSGFASVTVVTFLVRAVMTPFAHPLFTVLTGIGLGIAASSAAGRRVRRIAVPLLGLVLAMGMHALWNGSATFGRYGFYLVYGAFMVPVFGLVTWQVIRARRKELRSLAVELPAYAEAGWLTPDEPRALASMRARALARNAARRRYAVSASGHPYHPDYARVRAKEAKERGRAAARAVAEYEAFATSLASLRRQAGLGRADPDFAARELELLHHLWQRREIAGPALAYAARATHRRPPGYTAAWPPRRPYAGGPVPYAYGNPAPYNGNPNPYGNPAPYSAPPTYPTTQPYGQHPYGQQPHANGPQA
ncbi:MULTISPECIES: PrsW family glutamic-type intramembrane protease [unclassified Streptomyces]|uniref:PrsW family intramembrane metalloprotease n=1 Tax=unclassified Streptomyces TaxID=2593676 RepID=UPI002E815C57|nr:PrsW family glutamic-type intramembrane protease [Streptomyces sp. NBC_00523]WUD01337.1 PrsW family glutamic-type intramembrane protease [Streptomyces sp. NBC_00523]